MKNGNILIYSQWVTYEKQDNCVQQIKLCFDRNTINDSLYTLHIEKDGYITLIDTFTPRLAEALMYGEQDNRYKDAINKIGEWEASVALDDGEVIQHRITYKMVPETEASTEISDYDGMIRDTLMFRMTRTVSSLNENDHFRILDIAGGYVTLQKFDQQTGNVSANTLRISQDAFVKLGKVNALQAVSPKKVNKVKYNKRLTRLYSESTAMIPSEMEKYGLFGERRLYASHLIAECENVTPLLNRGLPVVSQLVEAITFGHGDLSVLCTAGVDAQCADTLAQLVRASQSLDNISSVFGMPGGVEYQVQEMQNSWEEFKVGESIPVQGEMMAHEMFTYGIRNFSENVVRDYLIFRGSQIGISETAALLSDKGVSPNECHLLEWSALSDKKELFAAFAAPGLIMPNNKPWTEYLASVFDNATHLVFDYRRGYLIKFDIYYVGRDYNSIVFYNATMDPVWRVIRVNEEFISYGNALYEHVLFK